MKEVRFGEDGDFSMEGLKNRISYDLANDLGNLVQRVLAFIQKSNGHFSPNYNFSDEEQVLFDHSKQLISKLRPLMDNQDLNGTLSTIWELIAESNKFVNDQKPWELAKQKSPKLATVLTVLCEAIKTIAFAIAPFMPKTSRKIFGYLNVKGDSFTEIDEKFSECDLPKPSPLFMKVN